jgi:hypothetical protein
MDATEVWQTDPDSRAAAPRPAVRRGVVNGAPHHASGRHSGIWLVLVAIAVLVASASLLGVIGGVTWAGIVAGMILLAVGLAGFAGGGRWAAATVAIMLLPALLFWLAARRSVDVSTPAVHEWAQSSAAEVELITHPAPVPVPSIEALDVYAGEGAFKCRPPAGWQSESGSEDGLAWLRLRRGSASIEIREVVGLGHALLRPDRQPDQTVAGVARDVETGEMIRTLPNTIFRGDLALEIICRGPDRDWDSLQPVFDEVIASIEVNTGV